MKLMHALTLLACAATYAHAVFTSNECTSPPNDKLYAAVLTKVGKCAASVELAVANPLTDEQRSKICHKCRALATATASKRFGVCTVKDLASGLVMTLQTQMEQIFTCGEDVVAPSGSGSGFDGIALDDTDNNTTSATDTNSTNTTKIGSGSQSGLAAEVTTKEGMYELVL